MRPRATPRWCPDESSQYQMAVHGRRERKTGPGFGLTVMRCATHGRAWTLYPPGHVPYGRVAVAAVAPSGGSVTRVDGTPSLAGTLHEAAEDAARGVRWPESSGECPATRRTQGRRLRRVAALLGLLADTRTQERIAHALSSPLLVLRDASVAYAASRRWRVMAAELCCPVGWPRGIAAPRLPQIRTCGIPASGSSVSGIR